MKIGDFAELAGVSKRTIDHYTNLGLLQPERSASGYRFYSKADVSKLEQIEQRKASGMSLEQIKSEFAAEAAVRSDVIHLKMETIQREISEVLQLLKKTDVEQALDISRDKLVLLQSALHLFS